MKVATGILVGLTFCSIVMGRQRGAAIEPRILSFEVRPALNTGLKVCDSQPVVGGYWSSAWETWVGSW